MNKEETIILITERIKSEHRKHKEIEWERIAAYKIYASLNKLYNLHGVIKAEGDSVCEIEGCNREVLSDSTMCPHHYAVSLDSQTDL